MKDLKIYIFLATALLVIYLVAQYNKPKDTDWTVTLNHTDKIPFGTYVLYNRINDILPGATIKNYREPVYNVINDDSVKYGTYIIIAQQVTLNKLDYEQLTQYIKNGNDVFIAAESFGPEVGEKLGIEVGFDNRQKGPTRIAFVNKQVSDDLYDVDKGAGDGYFTTFDRDKAIVLGKNQYEHCNYIKFPIGKGALFLSANPGMFSNYSLLKDMGASYASIALSYLKNDGRILWDEYYAAGRAGGESPMRVFLSNYKLKWAFYISFFSLIFFVLYEMKRRQRIIPVIEPLANTTVEFATVVGQVYYEQRNNSNIAEKKISYFLEDIRTKFGVRTNIFDTEFIALLSQKSGASSELIKRLTEQFIHIRMTSRISDSELINLNHNIEQFYLQSS
jgi:hypothetical protein